MPAAIQPLLDVGAPQADLARIDTAAFYSISNCLDGLRNISFGAFLLKQVILELENEGLPLKNFVTLSPIPGFRAWLGKQTTSFATLNPSQASKEQGQRLIEQCARFLTTALPAGRAVDPVTHFHLSNGASIERINWMADTSPKGVEQSFGLMVNYSYKPARIERNHEQYIKHARFAVSDDVRVLMRERRTDTRKAAGEEANRAAATPRIATGSR
jgi:malonyl-CoA decarboxylase